MGFRENLVRKIHIDALARKVIASIGPAGSGRRIDREAMKQLLETGAFRNVQERDLDLYILEGDAAGGRILVFDNDLAIFKTTVADIALRKSPYVKEMVSIRNIKKILNDADVVESKREASVKTVQTRCIDSLDLSFTAADIEAMAQAGVTALETADDPGLREILALFAELLGYHPAPPPFALDRFEMTGLLSEGQNREKRFGPALLYDPPGNGLRWVNAAIGGFDKEAVAHLHRLASGDEAADAEGAMVFQMLKDAVLRAKG